MTARLTVRYTERYSARATGAERETTERETTESLWLRLLWGPGASSHGIVQERDAARHAMPGATR